MSFVRLANSIGTNGRGGQSRSSVAAESAAAAAAAATAAATAAAGATTCLDYSRTAEKDRRCTKLARARQQVFRTWMLVVATVAVNLSVVDFGVGIVFALVFGHTWKKEQLYIN